MQNYTNHAHRPMLSAAGFLCWLGALVGFVAAARGVSWGAALGTVGLLGATLVALAIGRLYVTRLQDRIILLEMQVRGASLLTAEQQASLASLEKAQVVALRFANDEELPGLLERTVRESLTSDQIKRAIQHWRPDYRRT
jgi:hypothetical protein